MSQLRIDSIYAYTVIDRDGTEGIISWSSPVGQMPLVGADRERMASLRPIAQQVATQMGLPVSMAHFSQRTVLEVLEP